MPFPNSRTPLLAALAACALAIGCAPEDSADDADAMSDTEAQDVAGAAEAAPGIYSVAYENDAVRLLRVHYEPGETSAMHSHPNHCAVALSDMTMRLSPRAGDAADMAMGMGEVICVEAGAHSIENTSAEAADVVLVEFKPGAMAGSGEMPGHPDAVTADPGHYTVEHENDVARLIRIQYSPGETSTMHHHPAGCAIFLHDQPTTMELPDGEMIENEGYETGHIQCGDADAHLPTNVGDGELELILLELKGHAAWD